MFLRESYELEYYKGWHVFHNPDAKTYKYTAWQGSSYEGNLHSLRAKTLEKIRAKIEVE